MTFYSLFYSKKTVVGRMERNWLRGVDMFLLMSAVLLPQKKKKLNRIRVVNGNNSSLIAKQDSRDTWSVIVLLAL